MVFTNVWKLTTVIHIAYPHIAKLSLRIWEIRGNNAKTTPMKLAMGVIGYGVSPFMSGRCVGLVFGRIRPVRTGTGSFYAGGPRIAIANDA